MKERLDVVIMVTNVQGVEKKITQLVTYTSIKQRVVQISKSVVAEKLQERTVIALKKFQVNI